MKNFPPEIEKLFKKWEKDKTSRVFAALANAYRKFGLIDEALQILDEGLKHHPDYSDAYLVKGRIHAERGEYESAKISFEKVSKFDPQNAVAPRLLGEMYEKMEKWDSALECYKKLREIDPFFEGINEKIEEIENKIKQVKQFSPEGVKEHKEEEISIEGELSETVEPVDIEKREEFGFEEKCAEMPSLEELGEFLPEGESVLSFEEMEKPEESSPLLSESIEEVSVKEEIPLKQEKETSIKEMELAKIFEEQGFYDKALESYKKALEKLPHDPLIKSKIEELESVLSQKDEEIPFTEKLEEIEEEVPVELEEPEEEILGKPLIPEDIIETFEEMEFGKVGLKEIVEKEKEPKWTPHPSKEDAEEEKEKEILEEKFIGEEIDEISPEEIILPSEEKVEAIAEEEKEMAFPKEESSGTLAPSIEEEKISEKSKEELEEMPSMEELETPWLLEEIPVSEEAKGTEIKEKEEISIPQETTKEEDRELEEIFRKMHEAAKKEKKEKEIMEEAFKKEEEKIDEENYKNFSEWIQKLKK